MRYIFKVSYVDKNDSMVIHEQNYEIRTSNGNSAWENIIKEIKGYLINLNQIREIILINIWIDE